MNDFSFTFRSCTLDHKICNSILPNYPKHSNMPMPSSDKTEKHHQAFLVFFLVVKLLKNNQNFCQSSCDWVCEKPSWPALAHLTAPLTNTAALRKAIDWMYLCQQRWCLAGTLWIQWTCGSPVLKKLFW